MHVTLEGSSPGATTAGIMLLTRARQLGLPLSVEVLGDPNDIVPIPGPALCYAPVLASCGVGRELGSGATVVVPGPPGEPLLVTVHPHGVSGWFPVDRNGEGAHPGARAFVRLTRDARPEAREVVRWLRLASDTLGLSRDPAVLDVLFGADVPPLTRLAVGLRAGRSLSGGRGEPITRFVLAAEGHDPLPPANSLEEARAQTELDLSWLLNALSPLIAAEADLTVSHLRRMAESEPDLWRLLHSLAELTSYLVQLPARSILPPLGAAEDSVATMLRVALAAEGDGDANRQLVQTFQFLGGRYTAQASHTVRVCHAPPPVGRVARWQWFCTQVRQGRKDAEALWPDLYDPPS